MVNTQSYRARLLPHRSGCILGKLTIRHLDHAGAHAYMITFKQSDQFHIMYSGNDMISLTPESQDVPVKCGP